MTISTVFKESFDDLVAESLSTVKDSIIEALREKSFITPSRYWKIGDSYFSVGNWFE